MARVVLENVTKIYKVPKGESIRAVSDANLAVADGELLAVVGPSGCGKSTTLRLIAGLEEITSGTIAIGGQIVNGLAPKDRDIAMVFQHHALYPHMTARENLAFGLKLRKYSRAEIAERVGRASEILGLQDCLDRKPAALSGGQRQRVAVGRAIVRQPKVFLFDEPLSNLDAQMRLQMRREISALHRRLGATMIFVTHDQVEAMTLGDRIAVMQDGQIQQVAAPLELYERPANLFVAGFIGSPPMNFFHGSLAKNGAGTVFRENSLPGVDVPAFSVKVEERMAARLNDFGGAKIVLGLRPESITHLLQPSDAAAGQTADAVVEMIEPLGAETHLYAASGGHSLVARVEAGFRAEARRKIPLVFDMSQAHFFNPETGLNVSRTEA